MTRDYLLFKLRFVIKIKIFKRTNIFETRNTLVALITRIKEFDRFESNSNKKSTDQKKIFNFDNISRDKRFDSQSKRFNRCASSINCCRKKKTILSLRDNKSRNNKNCEDDANSIRTCYNCEKKKYIT